MVRMHGSVERVPTAKFQILFDLEDYAGTYRETRDAYLKAANELKLATGPYKAARDAYVAAPHGCRRTRSQPRGSHLANVVLQCGYPHSRPLAPPAAAIDS